VWKKIENKKEMGNEKKWEIPSLFLEQETFACLKEREENPQLLTQDLTNPEFCFSYLCGLGLSLFLF
jgi:hypothetical protein